MVLSRKRKIIIGTSAVVLLATIIGVSIYANRPNAPEVTMTRVTVRPELRSTVTASGEVRPIQFINLTSEVAGRIEEIYVSPGDQVKQGQPLVRLDPTQLQSSQEAQFAGVQAAISDVQNARTQVSAAENNVAQTQQGLLLAETAVAQARQQVVSAQTSIDRAKTDVDRAQVDLNTAQRELRRATELVESGVASRSEYDAARDRLEQAQVAVRTAQAAVRTAEAQLQQQRIGIEEAKARVNQQRVAVQDARTGVERARASVTTSEARASQQQALLRGSASQRSKATQISTLAGVVVDVPSKVGQFAVANFNSTPLMTIADMSTVIVKVNVDETEIADVEVGQVAKIKVDALGERELEGVVTQKNPLAVGKSDTQQGGISNRVNVQEAKEFEVVVELRNTSDEVRNSLRPGMSSTATITTKVKKDVLAVPLQAIVEQSAATASASPGAAASASPTPTSSSAEARREAKGVYVLQRDNKVKFVKVTTGITGETDAEITGGLAPDSEVITGPSRVLRTLKDGTLVKRQTRRPGAANSNESK